MIGLSRKILYWLDENSRSNLSNIAKICRTSPQMVTYSIKQMLKINIIRGFVTLFDYSRFDLNSYIVFFRLFYTKKEDFTKFIDKLKNTPELSCLQILNGKWDVYAMFLAPNPSHFNKVLQTIKSNNKKLIRGDVIVTTVVTYDFVREYLRKRKYVGKYSERKYVIIGGDRKTLDLTGSQNKICKSLLLNPLEKVKKISKKTGMSFLTITKGIKSLQERNIIRGFKPVIDFQKANIVCKKILIKYRPDLLHEDKLVSFCREHTNVQSISKSFGEWDLILSIETDTTAEFNRFWSDIRERYENMMADFEIMDVLKTEELKYLPKNYFGNINLKN